MADAVSHASYTKAPHELYRYNEQREGTPDSPVGDENGEPISGGYGEYG